MPRTNGGNINFNVNMTVNKNGLNQILKPLQQIQSQLNSMSTDQLSNEFTQAANSAKQLESIINSSWNDKLGQLNLDKFNQSVKNSYGSVQGLKNSLAGAGSAGQSAFNTLASQVLNTNLQLKESNKLLDDMATSMANTVKWGITSSIFNNITSSIQQAFYYAKDLDSSLNSIRIVTGDSADEMERFAKIANNAAKDLGRSTLDYTDAALSFYQQGLSDQEVQARTETTLKAQNITGSGTEMVDYLTSVWNGFKIQAEDTEEVVDKLAKVADSSASDMSELAIAMSKVAATANVMGVDVDQLTAQLATVIATTRQAPESVGTAFKTIYSRLNDIKTGADDAEISLGNYSGKMAELGFNVLDANGRLRDTGQVMEQIGSRWDTLSREQQIYLAQTMGGMRQVTQITALFENWTTYSELLNQSLSSQGSLNEKNNIYLESTAAYMKELRAQTERTYDILFNQDAVNGFASIFTKALELFNDYIEGIGGGANVFLNLGTVVANVFSKQIGTAINAQIQNIELLKNNLAQIKAQQEWSQAALDTSIVGHASAGDTVSQAALEKQAAITQRTLQVRKALTQEQYNQLQNLQREVGVEQTRIDYLEQYKTIALNILDAEDASTREFQERLAIQQQTLQVEEKRANAVARAIQFYRQNVDDEEQALNLAIALQAASNSELLTEQQKIRLAELQIKLEDGQKLTEQEIKEILELQNNAISKQRALVEQVNQGLQGKKAAQNGTLQQLKNQQAARERIIAQQQEQAARQIAIQNAVRRTTGVVNALSAIAGGLSVRFDQTATASQKANGAWSAFSGAVSGGLMTFNPMFGMAASGILNLGKSLLQVSGIWDKFQDHFKTTEERLTELEEKIHSVNSQLATDSKNISSLKAVQEEWDVLSEKAGDYGKNLKNMTKEEQDRYHELVDAFTQYNDAVILGYDAQGEKIIANRDQLQQTIDLLETQTRAQVMENLGDINQVFETQNTRINQPYKQLENLQAQKEQAHANLEYEQEYEKEWLESYGNEENVLWALQQEIITRNSNALKQFKILNDAQALFASDETKQKAESLESAIQEELEKRFGWTEDVGEWLKEVEKSSDVSKIPEYAEKFSQYNQVLIDFLNSPSWQTYNNNYQLSNDFNLGNIPLVESIINGQTTGLKELMEAADNADALYEKAKDSVSQIAKINTGLLMTIMENYTGYTAQWDALKTNENESFVRQLILDYMDSFTYDPEAISSKQDQIVNKAEDLLQFGRDYAAELGNIFDTTNKQVQKALKDADFENFEGTVKQRTQEAIRIINEVLTKLDPKQFKTEEARQALANILAASLDLKDVDIQLNEDGKLGVDTDKVVTEAEKNLENARDIIYETLSEKFGYRSENGANGKFGLNFLSEIFNEDELADFDNVINQINWGAFLKYTNEGINSGQALKKVWEEAKEARDQLSQGTEDLDFEVVFNQEDVVKHLESTKKLTDEEKNYLAALQQQDSKLAEIAEHEGYNSENYIKRLKAVAEVGQQMYKDQLESAKTLAQNEIDNAQAVLDSTESSAEAREEAELIIAEKKRELIDINYDLARTEQVLIDKANERIKAEEEDALAKAKTKSQIIPNAKSALTNLRNGASLSSDEAAALAYLEQSDETLRQIAEDKNYYSSEYTDELEKQIQLQGNLTEQARQQTIAVLQTRKARLEARQKQIQDSLVSDKDYLEALAKLNVPSFPFSLSIEERKAAQETVDLYEQQNGLREEHKKNEEDILELSGQIVQASTTGVDVLDEQVRKTSEIVDAFNKMGDTLTSGGELSAEEMEDFNNILDELVSKHYPELQGAADTLKETWLAGTEAYSVALRQVGQALDELMYKDLNQTLAETFEDLEGGLEDLHIGVDPTDFENWADEVEEFLDADKTITIAVHTDAENEFNRITTELDNIYKAAGKIGENFVVAADDIRELNNVFPGIIQGMQMLDDGSFQLNSNIVQRAIATAQATSGADAQAVAKQLQNQSELLHSKANTYKKMAEAAGVLAGSQVDSDMTAADARATISEGLAEIKATNAKLSSENEMDNEKIVADSSKDNSEVVANNWAGASQSAASSIYRFAESAIANYNAVAQAAQAAANGQMVFPSISLPTIASGYTGSGGSSKQASTLSGTQKALNGGRNTSQSTWAELQRQYQQMYQITEQAANDIDGMIVQVGAKVNEVGKGLEGVSRGQGIKKSKTSNSSSSKGSSPKSSSSKTPSSSSSDTSNKQEKEKDPDYIEYLEDEKDRYHDIDLIIKAIDKDLDNVQKTQKKLYGKDLINNLNQQVNLLEKQIEAYETKIELAVRERNEIQNSLKAQGVLFDRNSGAISNYASALQKKLDQVNSIISYYNGLSATEQQAYKGTVEAAKEDYENFKKQIERYDELVSNTLPELKEKIEQARDKQVEIAISKFKIAIEIELDLSQAKRDWNDFKKKVIDQVREEDILGNTKSTLENFFSYYDKNNRSSGLIPSLTDQVVGLMNQLDQINYGGFGDVYGNNKKQALEDLQNYAKELMNSLEDVEDIIKEVEEAFYDMVDAAQDAFDEQVKEYNFLSDLIDHDKKVIQLLYGEETYDKLNAYNKRQIETDKRELDFQKRQKDFWYAKMQAQKTRMQNLDKESNAYKEAEKRFKELEQHWLDAVKDFNSQVESSIQHLLDEYKNNVSIIFQDLNKNLTNGKGLEYIEEEWELINDNADQYLDTVNSMYEIQNLQQAFEDAIEDSEGNLNAQKSLTNLMNEQLKMLKDKDRLTKYDVDRANLLLQIEIKRLALEQSRNNKSKLRLRRDTQGNYTYQYVADEQQTAEAEQNLAETRNSLYNLDKDQYVKNQNDILSIQKDFNEKIKQLYEQYPIWTEQAEAKRQLLIEQYGMRINGLTQQNENIRLNLSQSAFDELASLYDTDVDNFINMSQSEQDELMSNLVPQWNSSVQEMTDKIAGQGGLIPVCKQAFEDLDNNTKNYEDSLRELQNQAGVSFENIGNNIDMDIVKTNELIDDNRELINTYDEEWDAIQRIIDQVRELTDVYRTAKNEAIAAAKAANNYIEAQRNRAAAQAAKQSQSNSAYGTSSNNYNNYNNYSGYSDLNGDTLSIDDTSYYSSSSSNNSNKKKKSSNNKKSSSSSASWSRIVEVYNLINSGKVANDPYRRGNLAKLGYNSTQISKGQELINKVYPPNLGGAGMSWDSAKKAMGYKTGGYTGDWGNNEGKIGILHEKELVLNKDDTENILSAVQATRDMSQLLKLMNINGILSNALSNLTNQNISDIDQKVYITAQFPAVNSRLEIEEAFSNLINRASQYSFNTRK